MPDVPVRDLEGWLDYVGGVHPKDWDLTLDRIASVAAALGVTRAAPLTFLVAGTNGKGSTCTYIDALLRASGLRTGLTTSPHLHRFNERYMIDGREPSDDAIVAAFEACERARGSTTLTLFEYGALVALLLFRDANLDACVLEIGLGGRFDAFNVAERDVAVITRVALDHTEWLGDDRETIGLEKAGILRSGIPAIIGDPEPPPSVLDEASRLGASLYRAGEDFECGAARALVRGSEGAIEVSGLPERRLPDASFAAALQAVAATDRLPDMAAIQSVARDVSMPGRFERRAAAPDVILDVAHNPDAARLLAERLRGEPGTPTIHAVFSCLEDKDLEGVLEPLAPLIDAWFVPQLTGARVRAPETLAKDMAELGVAAPTACDSPHEALASARCGADLVLAFGSFPLVAAVRDAIG